MIAMGAQAAGLALAVILIGALALRLRRRIRARRVILDGSNVMHWGGAPRLATLTACLEATRRAGLRAELVFDANAGYLLAGRHMNAAAMARALGLPRARVIVVPKGVIADEVILRRARRRGARIVTNDRYRDWAARDPALVRPERLIRGRHARGKVTLAPATKRH